jgi:hypothetical protein
MKSLAGNLGESYARRNGFFANFINQNNTLWEFLGTHWPALNVSGKVSNF